MLFIYFLNADKRDQIPVLMFKEKEISVTKSSNSTWSSLTLDFKSLLQFTWKQCSKAAAPSRKDII